LYFRLMRRFGYVLVLLIFNQTNAIFETDAERPEPEFGRGKGQEAFASASFTQMHSNGTSVNLVAEIFSGQDVASSSVRFCVDYDVSDTATLLNVVKHLQDAVDFTGNGQKVSEASETLLLKTAGAYKKRAAEASAEERHEDAVADYLRAFLRPGVDPQAATAIEALLKNELRELFEHRAAEAKEAAEAAAAKARARAEFDETVATERLRAENEADWAAWSEAELNATLGLVDLGDPRPPPSAGPSIGLSLTNPDGNSEVRETLLESCCVGVFFSFIQQAFGFEGSLKGTFCFERFSI
jgi:hypothetical protein